MSDTPWKIEDPNAIQIGWWYSYCCPIDTYPIADHETLTEVRERIADIEEHWGLMVWPSYQEALGYWERSGECEDYVATLRTRAPS